MTGPHPAAKLLALLVAGTAVASLATPAGVALALLLALPLAGRDVARLAGPLAGLLPLAAVLPLTSGWESAALVAGRAAALAALTVAVVASTPEHQLFRAAGRLGAPAALVRLAVWAGRFAPLLRGELRRTLDALRVRGFRPGCGAASYRVLGHAAGGTLLRAADRAERVAAAAACRGGVGSAGPLPPTRPRDRLFVAGAALLSALLLLADRTLF